MTCIIEDLGECNEPDTAVIAPVGLSHSTGSSTAAGKWEADHVLTGIYLGEYRSLVGLAVLVLHDVPTAEDVVQEAFIAMHSGWRRLRDAEKALPYLRRSVVNRSRSVLRHRAVVDRNAPAHVPDASSAEAEAIALLERSAVINALRGLPDRQREALVLRYYADRSEAEIAATMGISKGAVKTHTARGMAALRSVLEPGHHLGGRDDGVQLGPRRPTRARHEMPRAGRCDSVSP